MDAAEPTPFADGQAVYRVVMADLEGEYELNAGRVVVINGAPQVVYHHPVFGVRTEPAGGQWFHTPAEAVEAKKSLFRRAAELQWAKLDALLATHA